MKQTPDELLEGLRNGDTKSIARCLSLVENALEGSDIILKNLALKDVPVIGITGPPGAGKSTLVNALISELAQGEKKIAVLAIDPTSPFNYGALLGDRVRMSQHFNNEQVYIRSLATRGSLGGISAKTIELCDVLKSSHFDYILIETVGVGQSEIEIVGLADTTIVVLVPEAGDEIQHLKSGIMEIANAFVVNKADREGADFFANNLKKVIHQGSREVPVFKTIADKNTGITALADWIKLHKAGFNERKALLFAEKAYRLIQEKRMENVNKADLLKAIQAKFEAETFNIYRFVASYQE